MAKVCKPAQWCLSSLFLMFASPVTFSLGLGELRVHSQLNEPLSAEIPLIDLNKVDPSDIVPRVADNAAYAKENLEVVGWVSQIQFQVVTTNNKTVIKLSTPQPVKDPFADLLVQVAWPNGKLVREYAILLDPPSISNKKPVFNTELTVPDELHLTAKKARLKSSSTQIYKDVAFSGKYSPLEGETLWGIARELVKNTDFTVHQAVMAIAQKNQLAFTNGNINYIKKGSVLNLPSQAEVSAFSSEKAKHYVDAQIIPGHSVNTHDSPMVTSTEVQLQTKQLEEIQKPLKLVSPVEENEEVNKSLLAPQGKSDTLIGPQNVTHRLALVEEALDALKRTNEVIYQKNQHLQDQNNSLAELLAAKEAEINRIKQTVNKSPFSEEEAPKEEVQNHAIGLPDNSAKKAVVPSTSVLPSNTQVQNKGNLKQPSSEHGGVSTKKRDFTFVLFVVVFTLSLLGWIWYSRFYLHNLYIQLKTLFKKSTEQDQNFDISPENSKNVQDAFQLDLEKAMNAIDAQEKKIVKNRNPFSGDEKEQQNIQKKLQALLEDAEIYIAYERYHQAETILQEILNHENKNDPLYGDALLKLLELYVLTEKYDEYNKWYATIPADLKETAPKLWAKIKLLQDKVQSEMAVSYNKVSEEPLNLAADPVSQEIIKKIPETKTEPVPSKLSLVKEDEIQAQISLAKAYIEVGDTQSATEILTKYFPEASSTQQEEIRALLIQSKQK